MVNICFYISDHGYGHASRSIAVIRKILSKLNDVNIFVKTFWPFDFVKESLPQKNVEVLRNKNDIGVALKKNSINIDKEKTKKILNKWVDSWDNYIQKEDKFCKTNNINLILSDIAPQPFIVADKLNIPSIAISNFTWHYIYYNIFGEIPTTEKIKEAYKLANRALVLPFNEKMDIFKRKKEISLVSREITTNKHEMRKRHSVEDKGMIVYIGIGMSSNPSYFKNIKKLNMPNLRFLFSSNVRPLFNNIINIPVKETEMQNYIAMCDLVISRTGYGIVSEAIKGKVPMILFKRKGFKEDELTKNKVEELGIGKYISEKSFLEGSWTKRIDEMQNWKRQFDKLPKRFIDDGTDEIINTIDNID